MGKHNDIQSAILWITFYDDLGVSILYGFLWDFGGPKGFEINENTVPQPISKTGYNNNWKRSCGDRAGSRGTAGKAGLGPLKRTTTRNQGKSRALETLHYVVDYNGKHKIRFNIFCFPSPSLLAGERQGCPLSGILFAIAPDPFLRLLQGAIGVDDVLRACADDIGLVLAGWRVCLNKSISFLTALLRIRDCSSISWSSSKSLTAKD